MGLNTYCWSVVPGVGVGHVEPLAEQFVRMPLERLSCQFSKHLHFHGGLFVVHVALATKQQTATKIHKLKLRFKWNKQKTTQWHKQHLAPPGPGWPPRCRRPPGVWLWWSGRTARRSWVCTGWRLGQTPPAPCRAPIPSAPGPGSAPGRLRPADREEVHMSGTLDLSVSAANWHENNTESWSGIKLQPVTWCSCSTT